MDFYFDKQIVMLKINRRKFVASTAASAAGLMVGGLLSGFTSHEDPDIPVSESKKKDWMAEVKKYRKIDTHIHVAYEDDSPKTQLDFADRLGIDKMMISCYLKPFTKGSPDEFRRNNDLVIKYMKQYPDRFIGMMVLNPAYQKESLNEIERCVDAGLVGTGELYNHVKINDPLYYPIIERFIELKMMVMMHTAIGYSRVKLNPNEPKNISLPEDFVDIGKRYPEAMFQFSHIAGGIDWEYACKTLKDSTNVYVGLSGSNNEANMIDFAMKYIGEDRLLFSTDNSFYQGVGHVFSAKLTDAQRRKIFFENYSKILKKGGKNVD